MCITVKDNNFRMVCPEDPLCLPCFSRGISHKTDDICSPRLRKGLVDQSYIIVKNLGKFSFFCCILNTDCMDLFSKIVSINSLFY